MFPITSTPSNPATGSFGGGSVLGAPGGNPPAGPAPSGSPAPSSLIPGGGLSSFGAGPVLGATGANPPKVAGTGAPVIPPSAPAGDQQIGKPLSIVIGPEQLIERSQQSLGHFLETSARDERRGDSLIKKNSNQITKRLERVLDFFEIQAQGWTPQGLIDQIEREKDRLVLTSQTLKLTARVEVGATFRPARQIISNLTRTLVLQPVCESFGLEPQVCVGLLNSYFCERPEAYIVLYKLEQNIERLEFDLGAKAKSLLQQYGTHQALENDPQYMSAKQNLKLFHEKLERDAEKIRNNMIDFYMKERAALIQNLRIVLNYSSGYRPLPSFQGIRKNLEESLASKIIKSLTRNVDWQKEFAYLSADQQRQRIFACLQSEQVALLEILFCLALDQNTEAGQLAITLSNVDNFHTYLKKTNYRGSMKGNKAQKLLQVNEAEEYEQHKISHLGIITFLALIRVDKVSSNQDQGQIVSDSKSSYISKLLSSDSNTHQKILQEIQQAQSQGRVDSINAIVFLSYVLQTNGGKTEGCQSLSQQPFIEEIRKILQFSPLLTLLGHQSEGRLDDTEFGMNADFLKMLMSFLNLVWTPVLERLNLVEDQQNVQDFTVNILLKNPKVLKDIWTHYHIQKELNNQNNHATSFMTLNMFKDLLQQPLATPDNFKNFVALLRALCGKNRSGTRPADDVLEMILSNDNAPNGDQNQIPGQIQQDFFPPSKSSIIYQLLGTYIVLLTQLMNGTLEDQSSFDQLSNLIVIFSKIIKQGPVSNIDRVGVAFQEILQGSVILDIRFVSQQDLEQALQMFQVDLEEPPSSSLIDLLIQTMRVFWSINPDASREVLKHVIDAITAMFIAGNLDDRRRILAYMRGGQEQAQINTVIARNCMDFERNKCEYPCTVAYLKFMVEIFRVQEPQILIDEEQQTSLQTSFLDEMLQVVYFQVMKEFQNFKFKSVGHYAKFATTLFSLTFELISFFDSGNNAVLKIEFAQPNPRFDMLLDMILKYLKQTPLTSIMDALQLEEVTDLGKTAKERHQIVQNHYIKKLTSQQTAKRRAMPGGMRQDVPTSLMSSNGHGAATIERTRVNEMLSKSLECLNAITRLVLQRELSSNYLSQNRIKSTKQTKDQRGFKLFYIDQLNFVKEMRQQICEPSQQTNQKRNIVNVIAHYARLECEGDASNSAKSLQIKPGADISVKNNVLALEFLKLSGQIWQIHGIHKRIDLKLLLTKDQPQNQSMLTMSFIAPLIASLRRDPTKASVNAYLCQILEFLTICAQSQHNLIDLLFSQQMAVETHGLCEVITTFFTDCAANAIGVGQSGFKQALAKQVGSKLVSLLSVMAQERIGLKFVHEICGMNQEMQSQAQRNQFTGSHSILEVIVNKFIIPVCVKDSVKTQGIPIDCQQTEIYESNYNYCLGLLTIADFLKLVQSLFEIDPSYSERVRSMVQRLYSGEEFEKFFEVQSIHEVKKSLDKVLTDLIKLNSVFKQPDFSMIEEGFQQSMQEYAQFQRAIQNSIKRENFLTPEQRNVTIFNHLLASSESPDDPSKIGQIYIQSFDTFITSRALLFLQDKICTSSTNSSLMFSKCGPCSQFTVKGNLGAEFLVSTDELQYLLLANGFRNFEVIEQFKELSQQFNILVSALVSMMILDKAKIGFVLGVGKAKLIDNLKYPLDSRYDGVRGDLPVSKSFQMLASLFPLVNQDYVRTKQVGTQSVKKSIDTLTNRLLTVAKGILDQLKKESQAFQDSLQSGAQGLIRSLTLNQRHNQAAFEHLESVLGSLNLCVSESSLQRICKVEELVFRDEVLKFVSLDLLCNLDQIYAAQFSRIYMQSHQADIRNGNQLSHPEHLLSKSDDFNDQKLFQQIVLSSFQIMESITGEQQYSMATKTQETTGILKCVTKVEQIMLNLSEKTNARALVQQPNPLSQENPQKTNRNQSDSNQERILFTNCLRTLQVSLDLLCEQDMQREKSLKIITNRLVSIRTNQDIDLEETIQLLQYLNTYAQKKRGAYHMFAENIFQHLQMNKCIQSVNEHNFYVTQSGSQDQVRNTGSLVWCQVLLLVRSMSDHMLDDDCYGDTEYGVYLDQDTYVRGLVGFLASNGIDERIQRLLCFYLEDSKEISQALLEEISLTMCVVAQIFWQAESVNKVYPGVIQGLKDCLVFGITEIFRQTTFGSQSIVNSNSKTEKFFKRQPKGIESIQSNIKISFFDMKTQVHMIKIHMMLNVSLMDLILKDKEMIGHNPDNSTFHERGRLEQQYLFPPNWTYLFDMVGNDQVYKEFNQMYMFSNFGVQLKHSMGSDGQGTVLKEAFSRLVSAQSKMVEIYKSWWINVKQTKDCFNGLHQVLTKDGGVSSEYFGINSYFLGVDESLNSRQKQSFDQFIPTFENSLQMGNQLCALLLEMLHDSQQGNLGITQLARVGVSMRDVCDSAQELDQVLMELEDDLKTRGYEKSQDASHDRQFITHTFKLREFTNGLISKGSYTYKNMTSASVGRSGLPGQFY